MFRGHSFHNIDPKGRILIPSRFRDVLKTGGGDGVMLTARDSSLYAYSFEEWKQVEAKVLSLREKSDAMRRFVRLFIGGAADCYCDKQGRILVPPTLREKASLDKEIVLVGILDHFEIWSRERWDEENRKMEADLNDKEVRNEIAKLGL